MTRAFSPVMTQTIIIHVQNTLIVMPGTWRHRWEKQADIRFLEIPRSS